MPIYSYECRCGNVIEVFHKPTRVPKRQRCKCGMMAKRVLSPSAVLCDGISDVKWLDSAKKNLPRDAVKIESRGEWKRYLKQKNLECVG